MPRKRHKPKEIVAMLPQVDVVVCPSALLQRLLADAKASSNPGPRVAPIGHLECGVSLEIVDEVRVAHNRESAR